VSSFVILISGPEEKLILIRVIFLNLAIIWGRPSAPPGFLQLFYNSQQLAKIGPKPKRWRTFWGVSLTSLILGLADRRR
jgi:hypothetical protein